MTYNCPTCAAALKFNPKIGKLECLSCGNTYAASEFIQKDRLAEEKRIFQTEDLQSTASTPIPTMRMKVCSCSACGAKLAVSNTESATYCLYCGQPSIVLDRVISARKPKYIIPFSITREEALAKIRKKLRFRLTIPQKIIHFKVEKLQGIYVPYWLFDTKCEGTQYLSGTYKRFMHDTTSKYFIKTANCSLHNLTIDASSQLNDTLSRRLEPYDLSKLKSFNSAYLSGFYADCFDIQAKQLENLASYRTKQIFSKKMESTIPKRYKNITLHRSDLTCDIIKSEYAMLPAWFLSFQYKGESYHILVNGQTGKVAVDLPISKVLPIALGVPLGIFISLIACFSIPYIAFMNPIIGIAIALVLPYYCYVRGRETLTELKNRTIVTRDIRTNAYIKNRAKGD